MINIDSNEINAFNFKGDSLIDLKEFDKALKCYKEALKINPNSVDVLLNIGSLLLDLEEYQKAQNIFNKIISIDPENLDAFTGLGNLFFNIGKKEESIKYYDKAINIDPNYQKALCNKGIVLRILKNYEEALLLFNKVLTIDPKDGLTLCNKMRTLQNLNRNFEASEIDRTLNDPLIREICLEKHLEEKLVNNLDLLKPFGYDLELISQQRVCMDGKGRMDLFCKFKNTDQKIIIELKNVKATKSTFNQINNYVESMNQIKKHKNPIIGLVISRGYDDDFKKLIEQQNEITYLDLEQLGFE